MKSNHLFAHILFILLMFSLSLGQMETLAGTLIDSPQKTVGKAEQCTDGTSVTLSGAYSPYSVHLIKAEASGHIVRINAREGQILPANVPIMEIDSSALEKELGSLKQVLHALILEETILKKNLELTKRKYARYLKLKKAGHIEEQSLEDIESLVNNAQMAIVENRQKQAETRRSIAEITDRIKKSRPSFAIPLYVSQNFKELYETVVPGENLSRLLDVSKAKIHLVFSLSCFKKIEHRLKKGKPISFSIILADKQTIRAKGHVEKLKVDPDNHYLYSYGFDLVFPPIKDLVWGQVVQVKLEL